VNAPERKGRASVALPSRNVAAASSVVGSRHSNPQSAMTSEKGRCVTDENGSSHVSRSTQSQVQSLRLPRQPLTVSSGPTWLPRKTPPLNHTEQVRGCDLSRHRPIARAQGAPAKGIADVRYGVDCQSGQLVR